MSSKLPSKADLEIKSIAESNGCQPFWHDGIFGWKYHCGCEDELHFCDQQSSAISRASANRKRDQELIDIGKAAVKQALDDYDNFNLKGAL